MTGKAKAIYQEQAEGAENDKQSHEAPSPHAVTLVPPISAFSLLPLLAPVQMPFHPLLLAAVASSQMSGKRAIATSDALGG